MNAGGEGVGAGAEAGRPVVSRLGVSDAGELLRLQRAAYATEAQLHADPFLPPLTEPLEAIAAALREQVVLGVRERARLVGA